MSWPLKAPEIYEDEDERDLKLQFARAYAVDPSRVNSIGYDIFPGSENLGRAWAARAWESDPIVRQEVERLRTSGAIELAERSAAEIAVDVREVGKRAYEAKDKLSALRLEAELLGHISKGVNVNNINDNSIVQQNVLLVPSYVSREDFVKDYKKQQTELLANARSKR